jgi:hypothetical protein
MAETRVPLFERLPGIYPVRDAEQNPPGQLRAYLGVVEPVLGEIHRSIEQLYHDLFIETCDDWVVPYIGDLLGTSHLSGDPWTLRADVAGTLALRRRKGTLAAIERLTYNLTRWGVHAVELRDTLAWCQHLNHQRPDAGGDPPQAEPGVTRFTPVRGGTVAVRDPAMLSLTETPFDPWAHVADLRPPEGGAVRRNLPNLALFLWRLEAYRVHRAVPVTQRVAVPTATGDEAPHVVRVRVHPTGQPVRLFNVYQFDPDREPPLVTELDRVPGPILRARLDDGSPAGNPRAYVAVDPFDPAVPPPPVAELADVGLQLHVPEPAFAGRPYPAIPPAAQTWTIRGENLCAWEAGVRPPLLVGEIAVDPDLGRVLIGVETVAERDALFNSLRVTYTYAAPGAVGAHPVSRDAPPAGTLRTVTMLGGPSALRNALANLPAETDDLVVQIEDSGTYVLDLAGLAGTVDEGDGPSLVLARPLTIRAASGERPVILLRQPLRFRSVNPALAEGVRVRLEGLYLTRHASFPGAASDALVARAAIERVEVMGCTLDPGGHALPDGTRAPLRAGMWLEDDHGFDTAAEEDAFDQLPRVVVQQSVTGALRVDRGYALTLQDTIVDAGGRQGGPVEWAIASATDAAGDWGPPLAFDALTVFGRTRVESASGRGGVFTQRLEALDDQRGCIRYSCFSGDADRLPQNLGCVRATDAELRFSAVRHGDPAYARIADAADFRIRERGPDDDAMGAWGFLLDAAKLRNLRIRYREFMPVGIRPLLVPVT